MRRILVAILCLPASLACAGHAEDDPDLAHGWQEIEATLPAYPKPEQLIEFKAGPATSNRYFLDAESLSTGDDGMVHFTMVIKSPSGAQNVSFEGLRCTNGEHKLYAFGHPDGNWSRNRAARWEPIQARNQNNYQRELFFHYFCNVNVKRSVPELLRVLRSGGIYPQGD